MSEKRLRSTMPAPMSDRAMVNEKIVNRLKERIKELHHHLENNGDADFELLYKELQEILERKNE